MGLFEWLPFANKHGLNEDWMIKFIEETKHTLEEWQDQMDGFESRLTGLEDNYGSLIEQVASINDQIGSLSTDVGNIQITLAEHGRILTSFQGTLESIEARLVIIVQDITNLYNSCSNLGARVTLLEAATINPITMAVSPDSQLVSGMDLRYQPVRANGFPLAMTYTGPDDPSDHRVGLRYNQDKGFVIPDNDTGANELFTWFGDWNSETQLDTWSLTIRIYNPTENGYTDYKYENLIINTFGDGWHMIGDTGVQWDLQAGKFQLRWNFRQDSGADAGSIIRCIKLERGSTATEIIESRKDSDLQQIAASLSGSDNASYSGEATFSMAFECSPSKTWINDNCKIVADLKKVGKILSGAIRLYVETDEALTLSNLETSSVEIDVSSWNIPQLGVTSGNLLALQNDIITGEQYKLSGFNDNGILDHFLLQPHFTQITTTADGYFATIPFTVPLA